MFRLICMNCSSFYPLAYIWVKSPRFPAPHSSQVILQLTYVTNTNSIFWCKCSRIPFKPSFINGLCNFLTAMRCQKKNHITWFGGCVRCIKLESKPSYRADCLVFVLVLHLISYCSTFTAAQRAMCKNVAPLVQSNFPHIVSFDVSWW